jgi:hypothetical protein
MKRATLSAVAAAFLSASLLAQSTGAADVAILINRAAPRPNIANSIRPAPRPSLPVPIPAEPFLSKWGKNLLDSYAYFQWSMEVDRFKGDPAPATVVPAIAPVDRHFLPLAYEVGLDFALFFAIAGHVLHPETYQERIEGPWHEGQGIRYRVNYLESLGLTWNDAAGLHAFVPFQGRQSAPAAAVPFGAKFGTFFAGQSVHYEVEIENVGPERLRGLKIWSNQEDFAPDGGRGAAVKDASKASCPCEAILRLFRPSRYEVPGGSYAPSRIASLAPGNRIVIERFYREGSGSGKVNLEQTHLLIAARGAAGENVLANDPRAGIVDPPGGL